MDNGQEQILKLILEKVKHEKVKEAKELVSGLFEKMNKGGLNALQLAAYVPKIMTMVKPEHLDEVTGIVDGLKKNFNK